jgi:hypothetical protein
MRFQPYRTHHARVTEYINAEAGPSTLPPPRIPFVAPSITKPSGGHSETTADAEKMQTNTEEYKAPVNDFYRSHVPVYLIEDPTSEPEKD